MLKFVFYNSWEKIHKQKYVLNDRYRKPHIILKINAVQDI